jgi:hypothetical protein
LVLILCVLVLFCSRSVISLGGFDGEEQSKYSSSLVSGRVVIFSGLFVLCLLAIALSSAKYLFFDL